MGKHDAPELPFEHIYRGYQCEGCKGFWATVQLDEGLIYPMHKCLATEPCGGFVVDLVQPNDPPPDWVPVILEWFKPTGNYSFYNQPLLDQYLENDGLIPRPTIMTPDWAKARVGHFGEFRTY